MEDISRELEREIARSKPAPFKRESGRSILIIDSQGSIRSGDYMRPLMRICLGAACIGLIVSGVCYYYFSSMSRQHDQLLQRVDQLSLKNQQLIKEREVLMARLVMSGKTAAVEKKKDTPSNVVSRPSKPAPVGKTAEKPSVKAKNVAPAVAQPKKKAGPSPVPSTVAIDKFSYKHNPDTQLLRLKFNIQNASGKDEVSGRIFVVLEPVNKKDPWLALPRAVVKGGLPTTPERGQYFSIQRFKPVSFKAEGAGTKLRYKSASAYVYNDKGEVVCRESIQLVKEGNIE